MRPRLIAVWGLLAVLVGVIVFVEMSDRANEPAVGSGPVRDPRLLVPVPLEQVGAIEVMYEGTVHRFERDANGAWFYHGAHAQAQAGHSHQTDPAMAERIAKALAGFDRARMERDLPLQEGGKELGLAVPSMVILVYAPKQLQPLAQFAVGDVAPDKFSRYVLPVGKNQVVTIANYQIDNLVKLIADVKSTPASTSATAGPSSAATAPAAPR